MREIKFRAWDRKARKMRTVDDLKNLWTLCNHGGEAETIPNVIVVNQSYKGGDLQLVVDKDCDLMQYTGLKDKNGKEIYEGDIVHGFETMGGETVSYEVKYDPKDDFTWGFPTGLCNQCEIIGNIYEDKKILDT